MPPPAGKAGGRGVGRLLRLLIVVAGIIAGQAVLYGPSLIGAKILLPLSCLAGPNVYLPATAANATIVPHDPALSDLVFQGEILRRFSADELRAGRFPAWVPYQYGGVPAAWARFSPFLLLAAAMPSPFGWAWVQLAAALVAGLGMYAVCRAALGVGLWPAAVAAWCYPMTGFLVLLQGFSTCGPLYWLPWLWWAIDRVCRAPGAGSVSILAGITALTVFSGQLDIVAQALLVSALFGAWCVWNFRFGRIRTCALGAVGVTSGLLLAAPYWLPLLEYSRTGTRMERRVGGAEERPPVGISALPLVVLPDLYGSSRTGSVWLGQGNQVESTAGGYAGVVAVLLLAPLAWMRRERRGFVLFGGGLIFLALAWPLGIPGLTWIMRLPGMNLMSHNRLVFVIPLAVLMVASVGLDRLWENGIERRRWFWVPALLLAGLAGWSLFRANVLPEPVATRIGADVAAGGVVSYWIRDSESVARLHAWFVRAYLMGAVFCLLALFGWLVVGVERWRRPLVFVLAFLLPADLVWFAYGRSAQSDPALYYPRIPALEEIARAEPGRVIGYHCLPPTLAASHGLKDVRGYDAIDPRRWLELVKLAADPRSSAPAYAETQWLIPRINLTLNPQVLRFPPVFDLLGVRYLIFRGVPAPASIVPRFRSDDYWVLENRAALPRVFVPRSVEPEPDAAQRLRKLGANDFNPRAVAYSEQPTGLAPDIRGMARIVSEIPTRVLVSAEMETPGLVVFADLWDAGWHARIEGRETPILRVNHALRGVEVPPGKSEIEFWYRPRSFVLGLWLCAGTVVVLVGWVAGRRVPGRFFAARSP